MRHGRSCRGRRDGATSFHARRFTSRSTISFVVPFSERLSEIPILSRSIAGAIDMLRQFLVGAAVSVCNIVIHALVMTAVVRAAHRRIRIHPAGPITGARKTPRQSQRLIYVSVATISVLMACPCLRGDRLLTGLRDRRRCACWRRLRIFCIRELHDAWLWRRNAGGALAAAWTHDGDERRAHVRLVDCRYFRSAAESGEIRRRGGERSFRRERMNYKRLIHVAPFQD